MFNELKVNLEKLMPENILIFDISYVKEAGMNILRITIENTAGEIDLEQCVEVTHIVNEVIDATLDLQDEYYLEVSSKGAEEPIKTKEQLVNAIGAYIYVKTYANVDNRKEFLATLIDFKDDVLTLQYDDKSVLKTVAINYELVANCRYSVKF